MKNKYFILAAIVLIAGSVFTGCNVNREKKVEDAKEDVEKANQDMNDAQAQFEKEWQQFKSDAELKINANQQKIDDFKVAMKTTSAKFKAKYENEVVTLEQKNIELKKKLNEFKYEGKKIGKNSKKRLIVIWILSEMHSMIFSQKRIKR